MKTPWNELRMAKRYCMARSPEMAKMPKTHVMPMMQKKLALTFALSNWRRRGEAWRYESKV
tara:strand:+ start:343 stop:525 length:183 start_codon:yes stop_codon:yes gene_type:complete